jgi:hypothetical protein
MKFDRGQDHDLVCCEVCDNPNGLHIRAVRVNRLGRTVSIGPVGIEQFDDTRKTHARGSIVEIDFWCESGNHPFTAVFEFHKGQVLHSVRDLPPLPSIGPEGYIDEGELPRN